MERSNKMSWIYDTTTPLTIQGILECEFCGAEVCIEMGYCMECDEPIEMTLAPKRPAKALVCEHEDAPCCGCDSPLQYLGAEVIA
jgi:hypothetical protein